MYTFHKGLFCTILISLSFKGATNLVKHVLVTKKKDLSIEHKHTHTHTQTTQIRVCQALCCLKILQLLQIDVRC